MKRFPRVELKRGETDVSAGENYELCVLRTGRDSTASVTGTGDAVINSESDLGETALIIAAGR